ncbi:uncharacterized protein LOC126322588 [Schistocerca gregaria]|uniref:uncharacterized protein LOC126322588 n=1 Tax=Schistocerca gregaria TaxID=7010 RepID=UPI00211E3760|nr:uncharacterized protein LOC126322588 [Schistocerca gregaria]
MSKQAEGKRSKEAREGDPNVFESPSRFDSAKRFKRNAEHASTELESLHHQILFIVDKHQSLLLDHSIFEYDSKCAAENQEVLIPRPSLVAECENRKKRQRLTSQNQALLVTSSISRCKKPSQSPKEYTIQVLKNVHSVQHLPPDDAVLNRALEQIIRPLNNHAIDRPLLLSAACRSSYAISNVYVLVLLHKFGILRILGYLKELSSLQAESLDRILASLVASLFDAHKRGCSCFDQFVTEIILIFCSKSHSSAGAYAVVKELLNRLFAKNDDREAIAVYKKVLELTKSIASSDLAKILSEKLLEKLFSLSERDNVVEPICIETFVSKFGPFLDMARSSFAHQKSHSDNLVTFVTSEFQAESILGVFEKLAMNAVEKLDIEFSIVVLKRILVASTWNVLVNVLEKIKADALNTGRLLHLTASFLFAHVLLIKSNAPATQGGCEDEVDVLVDRRGSSPEVCFYENFLLDTLSTTRHPDQKMLIVNALIHMLPIQQKEDIFRHGRYLQSFLGAYKTVEYYKQAALYFRRLATSELVHLDTGALLAQEQELKRKADTWLNEFKFEAKLPTSEIAVMSLFQSNKLRSILEILLKQSLESPSGSLESQMIEKLEPFLQPDHLNMLRESRKLAMQQGCVSEKPSHGQGELTPIEEEDLTALCGAHFGMEKWMNLSNIEKVKYSVIKWSQLVKENASLALVERVTENIGSLICLSLKNDELTPGISIIVHSLLYSSFKSAVLFAREKQKSSTFPWAESFIICSYSANPKRLYPPLIQEFRDAMTPARSDKNVLAIDFLCVSIFLTVISSRNGREDSAFIRDVIEGSAAVSSIFRLSNSSGIIQAASLLNYTLRCYSRNYSEFELELSSSKTNQPVKARHSIGTRSPSIQDKSSARAKVGILPTCMTKLLVWIQSKLELLTPNAAEKSSTYLVHKNFLTVMKCSALKAWLGVAPRYTLRELLVKEKAILPNQDVIPVQLRLYWFHVQLHNYYLEKEFKNNFSQLCSTLLDELVAWRQQVTCHLSCSPSTPLVSDHHILCSHQIVQNDYAATYDLIEQAVLLELQNSAIHLSSVYGVVLQSRSSKRAAGVSNGERDASQEETNLSIKTEDMWLLEWLNGFVQHLDRHAALDRQKLTDALRIVQFLPARLVLLENGSERMTEYGIRKLVSFIERHWRYYSEIFESSGFIKRVFASLLSQLLFESSSNFFDAKKQSQYLSMIRECLIVSFPPLHAIWVLQWNSLKILVEAAIKACDAIDWCKICHPIEKCADLVAVLTVKCPDRKSAEKSVEAVKEWPLASAYALYGAIRKMDEAKLRDFEGEFCRLIAAIQGQRNTLETIIAVVLDLVFESAICSLVERNQCFYLESQASALTLASRLIEAAPQCLLGLASTAASRFCREKGSFVLETMKRHRAILRLFRPLSLHLRKEEMSAVNYAVLIFYSMLHAARRKLLDNLNKMPESERADWIVFVLVLYVAVASYNPECLKAEEVDEVWRGQVSAVVRQIVAQFKACADSFDVPVELLSQIAGVDAELSELLIQSEAV